MERPIKILMVVNDISIASSISLKLSATCCETTAIVAAGEDAINLAAANHPDIIIIGIQLKGEMDGFETARYIHEILNIPIIYLTDNSNEKELFKSNGKEVVNFISSSFDKTEIEDVIRLVCTSHYPKKHAYFPPNQGSFKLNDAIFVKHYEKMIKIPVKDILFIKADRNYSCIQTKEKRILVVITLRELYQKLPPKHFLRIHRSFIINLSQIEEIGTGHVLVGRMTVPLSKNLKQELLNHLRAI